MISVVLPTYNEVRSIEEALRRASEALRKAGEAHELIVVDDSSPDGTADVAETLGKEIPVKVLRRPGRQGLATAVVDGWKLAQGDTLGAIDADLQHPPEVLARLASALRAHNADVAIATRSGPGGGSSEEWSWARRLNSWTARHLAACVLPQTLAEVSDPMSGMFLIRARALEGVRLEPTGYKILLEVLGKARYRDVVEVPFMFKARSLGSSKLGMRESLQYLEHLARLARSTGQLRSWIGYAVVGFTGAVVNVAALTYLVERRFWPVGWGLAVAIPLALLNNFLWNWLFTFSRSRASDKEGRSGILSRLAHYAKVCAFGAALNAVATLILQRRGVQIPLASAAGVALGGVWNLFFNVPAIWRSWDSPTPHSPAGAWDESGNRRLSPVRNAPASHPKNVLVGPR
jgi:dolichol-phosphate mannosyltransferase